MLEEVQIKVAEAMLRRIAKTLQSYRPRPAWLDVFIRQQMSKRPIRGIRWGDSRGEKLPPWQAKRLKTLLLAKRSNALKFWEV